MRWPLVLSLVACTGADTDTDTTDTTDTIDDGPPTFEDFINVELEATGDYACHPGGEPWLAQSVEPSLQVIAPGTATVVDFESEDLVPAANVDFWYADDVSTAPDVSGVSDDVGEVSLDLKVCTPLSYRTWTDPDLDATRDTYEAHQIVPPGDAIETELNSVSSTTYAIIPAIVGVSVEPDKGIIAGTAKDCLDQEIEFAQVIVRDAEGNIPETLLVKYFVDSFPNRDQLHTSADGLWLAVNVPEGTYTVEMWTVRDGTLVLSGQTVVQSYPNSINISNIYAGYGDGVRYPDECLAE